MYWTVAHSGPDPKRTYNVVMNAKITATTGVSLI